MGLRADMQYCGQYQNVLHTTQSPDSPPKRATEAPTVGRTARESSSEGSRTNFQQNRTALTIDSLRLHEAAPSIDLSEDVEAAARRHERAAKDLGFDMPPGWRVGGLDDYGLSPMDRWLGGSAGVPGYPART